MTLHKQSRRLGWQPNGYQPHGSPRNSNKYFEELEQKMNANIEAGKKFLKKTKRPGVVTLPSGLQYEVINEAT